MSIKILCALFIILNHISSFGQAASPANYSDRYNWAVLPSDSFVLNNPFISETPFENVDVFYVYPTLLVSDKDERWNYEITDEQHRSVVENKVVKYQASAWSGTGNLYVPFYNQAHLRSYFNLEGKGREALLLAYADIKAAFEYYLEHYNNGHGIVLAGHSQGSTHISLLMKEFFDNKPLKSQLIAAYLPGIGVKDEEFSSIPLLTEADQIGGYVTWNTFKKKYKSGRYEMWYKGTRAINPVTWDTIAVAERNLHKGFLFSNDKLYEKCFTTHLVDGGVWISRPKVPFRLMSLSMKNYHIGDVNLFWEDIRINVRLRALNYLNSASLNFMNPTFNSDQPAEK